jgi:sugar phosphate isomerase/epimerase
LSAEEISQSIRKLQPYIVHTTAADYIRMPRYQYQTQLTNYAPQDPAIRAVPMGEGFIDYRTFFTTLKDIGYQGYIAYEMCEVLDGGGTIENLDATAKQFIDYVKQFD